MVDSPRSSTAPSATWRAVICDARPMVRAGLANAVDGVGVTELTDLANLPEALGTTPPDVLIAGLRADDVAMFQAISLATATHPDLKVLIIGDHATVIDLREAILAGVTSYLLSDAPLGEIRSAAIATARGDRMISPAIALLAGSWRSEPRKAGNAPLTPRELEVLQLLAEGLTNDSIGERIGLSSRTVKTQVQNLLTKLDVTDRTGAVARAFRLGLIH